MKPEDLQNQIEATESYLRLLNEARECRKLYLRAGMQLPPLLAMMFEEQNQGAVQLTLGMGGPDIDSSRLSTKPPEAEDDWISLRAEDASPTTVALALLRGQNGRPIRAKDLSDLVTAILPHVASGSIYNLLNRLENESLAFEVEEGWEVRDEDVAGIISRGYLWSPPERLTKMDLAAHRREAILHLLTKDRYLQVMQIVNKLRNWSWVHAPINKDLVKDDMQVLEKKGRARRIGDSRNWELAPQ